MLQVVRDLGRKAELTWMKDHAELKFLHDSAKKQMQWTPDWARRLALFKYQYLFVYGNHMTGHKLNDMLERGAELKHPGFTRHQFRMYKQNVGDETFPIALGVPPEKRISKYPITWRPSTNIADPAIVQGQLYIVETDHIRKVLDPHFQNTQQFLRHRTEIMVPFRWKYMHHGDPFYTDELAVPVRAWMYIGVRSYWDEMLDGLNHSPVKIYTPTTQEENKSWKRPYYHFSKQELDVK